jgi:ATP-dependent Clp protease ATP-binding subunit ClpA
MLEELDSGQYAQAFLRRLNYIGYANNFNDQDYKDLVRAIFVHDLGKALKEYLRVEVRLSESAIDHLAKLSINRTKDAANVASTLRNFVVAPIRQLISQGGISRNDIIDFDHEGQEFKLYKLDKNLERTTTESFESYEARTPRYDSAAWVPRTCQESFSDLF